MGLWKEGRAGLGGESRGVGGRGAGQVTFKLAQSEEGTQRRDYLVTLKRGSWGPEHAVMSFEVLLSYTLNPKP